MRFCPTRFAVNTVPVGSVIACVALGVVLTFPQAPQVSLPYRQTVALVVPVPNSLVGTRPDTRSAFVASPVSTYCFGAARPPATPAPTPPRDCGACVPPTPPQAQSCPRQHCSPHCLRIPCSPHRRHSP